MGVFRIRGSGRRIHKVFASSLRKALSILKRSGHSERLTVVSHVRAKGKKSKMYGGKRIYSGGRMNIYS